MHALGNAMTTSCVAAENLVRNQYATFKRIRTLTVPVSGIVGDDKTASTGSSLKAKLVITLQRGPDFYENMRKFQEVKEENDRLAAEQAAKKEAEKEAEKGEEKKEKTEKEDKSAK